MKSMLITHSHTFTLIFSSFVCHAYNHKQFLRHILRCQDLTQEEDFGQKNLMQSPQ